MSRRILIVDDEQDLCEILKFNLEAAGYAADTANSAEEVLRMGHTDQYDLLLLDVMMDGMSGFELARRLKKDEKAVRMPIIFLTAKDTEDDIVRGLDIGADDYIAKPFAIREVLARIQAVFRRVQTATNVVDYQSLKLNMDKKAAYVDGRDIALTKTEFALLHLLLSERGRVFTRQELLERVWPDDVIVTDRTVDVNITRLRRKVGRYASHIVTRLGFGYYFEDEETD